MSADGWFDGLTPVPVRLEAATSEAMFPFFRDLTCRVDPEAEEALRSFLRWAEAIRRTDVAAQVVGEDGGGGGDARLEITCAAAGMDEESYTLTIDAERQRVRLEAPRSAGVCRGLATLLQLTVLGAGRLRGCRIEDRPRFAWRGLMVDVSRHFIPLALLERSLDAMALCKMNVLHLHLTDDQGFRIESTAFPRLHGLGSDGEFFTRDQIRALVARAHACGIRVVPEFDLPGHASSWLVGHPELGCDPGATHRIAEGWGCHDVCLDPTNEAVYAFLEEFFVDVLPLFPDDVVHIGGDEVKGDEWRRTPHIVSFMQENGMRDTAALQAYFNTCVRGILARHGKRAMGWDEIVHEDVPHDVPREVIVQSWRGPDSVAAITALGYPCVRSHGYYLDALWPAVEHYAIDPGEGDLVLGGEACMWTEFVDAGNFESRVWPRTVVIAERLWSAVDAGDPVTLPGRLSAARALLERLGVAAIGSGSDITQKRGLASAEAAGLAAAKRDTQAPEAAMDRHSPLCRMRDLLPVDSAWNAISMEQLREGRFDEFDFLLRDIEDRIPQFVGLLEGAADPLVGRLLRVVEVGRRAVRQATGVEPVDAAWIEVALAELERCAEPHAGLRVALTEPVAELVRSLRP